MTPTVLAALLALLALLGPADGVAWPFGPLRTTAFLRTWQSAGTAEIGLLHFPWAGSVGGPARSSLPISTDDLDALLGGAIGLSGDVPGSAPPGMADVQLSRRHSGADGEPWSQKLDWPAALALQQVIDAS